MKTDSGRNVSADTAGQPAKRSILGRPSTKPGWWAVGLAVTFVVLWTISTAFLNSTPVVAPWMQIIVPFYGIVMLLCGLAGGIIGLIAVIRWHERSLFVWFTLLPGIFVIVFILGEILIPH